MPIFAATSRKCLVFLHNPSHRVASAFLGTLNNDLMVPAAVFRSCRAFDKEEHEAHEEHRKNKLSHNFGTSNLQPWVLRSQPVASPATAEWQIQK